MKARKLRFVIPAVVLLVAAVGFATRGGIGTLSAFGWQDISLLCPLGSLTTMLAAKAMVPRALVSLVVAVVLIVVVGKAFCAWVCPVPLVSKLRDAFSKKKQPNEATLQEADGGDVDGGVARGVGVDGASGAACAATACVTADEACEGSVGSACGGVKALTEDELRGLSGCAHGACLSGADAGEACAADASAGCSSCAENRKALSSRHFVLGGSLLSAAIFGFPVFCLVCPIGLTFASILLIMRLFSDGDMTWAVVVAPALLLIEVVFFRKWCHTFCPLGALMGLVAKANRTFQPVINKDVCYESTRDAHCGKCAEVCPEGIDLRNISNGAPISECTRCRSCIEACPSGAISMPLLAPKRPARADALPETLEQQS